MSFFRSIFRQISSNNSYQVSDYGPSNDAFTTFLPDDISGLTFWLDASDASSWTATGGYLDSVTNKGSLGGTANAPNSSERPYISSSYVNNRDVFSFDGVDDILSSSINAAEMFGVSGFGNATAYTACAVLKLNRINRSAGYPYQLDVIAAEGGPDWIMSIGSSFSKTNRIWVDRGSTTEPLWTTTASSQIASGSTMTVLATFSTGTLDLYYNGTFVTGTVVANPFVTNASLRIGGEIFPTSGDFAKFEFCEFLIYENTISPTQIAQLHSYHADRWGF